MSYNVSLFVDSDSPLEEFADEVGSLLGIALRRIETDGAVSYEYSSADFTVLLYADHELENDRDMKFEDYRYELSFRRHNPPNREAAQAKTLTFAQLAFQRVKDTRRYSLMLVENTQRKLDSFELAK